MIYSQEELSRFSNFSALFADVAGRFPERPVFTWLADGENCAQDLSYAEADLDAKRISGFLNSQGLAGQNTLLFFPPSLDFLKAFLGCTYSGTPAIAAFPPDPTALENTLPGFLKVFADCGAKVILTNRMVLQMATMLFAFAPALQEARWIAIDEIDPACAELHQVPKLSRESELAILYTSGSTDDPKGVILTHGNFLFQLASISQELSLGDFYTNLLWVPLYHSLGLGSAFQPLLDAGRTVLFSPKLFLEKPSRWVRAISNYRAANSAAPNFAYELCARSFLPEDGEGLDLSCWRSAICGGERNNPATMEAFSRVFSPFGFRPAAFNPSYGITETALGVSISRLQTEKIPLWLEDGALQGNEVRLGERAPEGTSPILASGSPFPGIYIRIVRPGSQEPIGGEDAIGEIWIHGPGNAKGYWGKPELSSETFENKLIGDERNYFRSGDLGFLHQGEIFITGRIKDLVIIRGKNHYPQDIENSIHQHVAKLKDAPCIAFSTPNGGEEDLILLIEKEGIDKEDLQALNAELRSVVAKYHGISLSRVAYLPLGSIPRTRTQKFQRGACKSAFQDKSLPTLLSFDFGESAAAVASGVSGSEDTDLSPESWLKEYFSRHLGGAPVDLKASLASYGLDSLKSVQLTQELQRQFQVPLGVLELMESPSLENLIHKLESRIAATGAKEFKSAEEFILSESLPVDFHVDPALPRFRRENKASLITGVTGFLGAYLLQEILDRTEDRAFCLIRAQDPIQAMQRVQDNLESFGIWKDSYRDRIVPVLGDLSRPRFGLSENDYDRLCEEIDVVYHNAAIVNFIYSYFDLRDTNVLGTQRALAFAAEKKIKFFNYVSSLSVFPFTGKPDDRPFLEKDTPEFSSDLINGYAQSKWVGDKLTRDAGAKGLPVAIYRAGEVIGHSQTGKCHAHKDAYSLIIKGCSELGSSPTMDFNFNLVPVDYVTKAIVALSNRFPEDAPVYHLTNPVSYNVQELTHELAQLGVEMPSAPYEEWLRLISENEVEGTDNPLRSLAPFFDSEPLKRLIAPEHEFGIDSTETRKALEAAGIQCPSDLRQLLTPYLSYLRQSGFLSQTPLQPTNQGQLDIL